MADDLKKNLRKLGVTDAEFAKAMADSTAQMKEQEALAKKLTNRFETLTQNLREQGAIASQLNGNTLERKLIAEAIKETEGDITKISKDDLANIGEKVAKQKKLGTAINQILPGVTSFASGVEDAARGMSGILGPAALAVALFTALAKLALDFAKNVAETRKDLGVSAITAAKLQGEFKLLGFQAKAFGLDIEDVKNAQRAILSDLGASVREATDLSLSFARTAAATGQSSEDLAKTLSVMESMSDLSREILLNQIRTNAAMIEAAGVAPALVMRDIAQNAEFFAKFARDGGQNIIDAGVAARKLGLELSAVNSISESLLDFETSIEKQLEASLLIGRQLNLDRARQLALAGDQEGVVEEIRRQVGGEAEFNRLNVIARQKLADAVGVNVEQLSRIVRNNTAASVGAAAGAAGDSGLGSKVDETNSILRSGFRKLD
jgi:hypothetical protein